MSDILNISIEDSDTSTPRAYITSSQCSYLKKFITIVALLTIIVLAGFFLSVSQFANATDYDDSLDDGTTLPIKYPVAFVLVNDSDSRQFAIYKIQMDNRTKNLEKTVVLSSLEEKSSLEVDCENKKIYFFYRKGQEKWSIKEMSYDGLNESTIAEGLEGQYAMTIDSKLKKLYWTDDVTRTINVMDLITHKKKVLNSTEPYEPRSIVFHPRLRKLFWSNHQWENENSSDLEVADENGLNTSNKTFFLHDSIKNRVYHLAIDLNLDELCWTTNSSISCANVETQDVRTVYSSNNDDTRDGHHPFLLRISSGVYYWTRASQKLIYYSNNNFTTSNVFLDLSNSQAGDIRGLSLIEDECPFNE